VQKRSWRRDADVLGRFVRVFGGSYPGGLAHWPWPTRGEAFDAYKARVDGYLAAFKGTGPRLTSIHPEQIQKYMADRLAEATGRKAAVGDPAPAAAPEAGDTPRKCVSPMTVNRELELLSNMFNVAINWGYARHNPASSKVVKRFRGQSLRERYLTAEEEKRLFALLPEPAHSVALTSLHTGMRFMEVLSLQPENVDLERREVTITATNSKSRRVRHIPLNDVALGVLAKAMAGGVGRPRVFTYEDGSNVKSIRTVFEKAVKAAGLTGFRFHDLRHTFASRLVSRGADLNTVRELLGHRDFTTTLRYAHLAPSTKQAAVELLMGPEVGTKSTKTGSEADLEKSQVLGK
jgi:integrase